MPRGLIFSTFRIALFSILCFGFSHSAWAGFQWVAPNEPAPTLAPAPAAPPIQITNDAPPVSSILNSPGPVSLAPSAPASSSVTVMDSGTYDTARPLVIDGSQANPQPLVIDSSTSPELPVAKAPSTTTFAPLPPSQHTVTVPATAPVAPPAPQTPDEIVHGFAKNVPLAVALRQILPGGYTFAIDQGVDMGASISFQGGRGWRETLRESLGPVGLTFREQGSMVSVGYPSNATSPTLMLPSKMAQAPAVAPAPSVETPVIVDASVPSKTIDAPGAWSGQHGDMLRKVLEDWCHRAHVDLDWRSEYDYPLQASMTFSGTFEDAVRNLLTGFQDAHPQPIGELHANQRVGQMVLVIQTRGNSNAN